MGRLTTLIIFLVALQAILIIFEGSTPSDTSIWKMAVNPSTWNNLDFIITVCGVAAGIALAGIVLGSFIGIKTDFMMFSSMIIGLMSLGIPIVNLANVVGKYASNIFCGTAIYAGGILIPADAVDWLKCPGAIWIVAITAGVLGVYYVFTVVDWWRSRD